MIGRRVFVTGGTGYLGRRLLPELLSRGHGVTALVRPSSEERLPTACIPVVGDALDASTFIGRVAPADTFVHLVGTPRPGPTKAHEFLAVDLPSARAGVQAASASGVRHFVYVSVAQPAPVMKAYVDARAQGERLIRKAGIDATILRPWYVLGPGHRWPYVLLPFYWIAERIPAARDGARRLGLVTLPEMIAALVRAVEDPPMGVRIVEVPAIRAAGGPGLR